LTKNRNPEEYKVFVNILSSQNATEAVGHFLIDVTELHATDQKAVIELSWVNFNFHIGRRNFTGAISPLLDLVKLDPHDLRARTYRQSSGIL